MLSFSSGNDGDDDGDEDDDDDGDDGELNLVSFSLLRFLSYNDVKEKVFIHMIVVSVSECDQFPLTQSWSNSRLKQLIRLIAMNRLVK